MCCKDRTVQVQHVGSTNQYITNVWAVQKLFFFLHHWVSLTQQRSYCINTNMPALQRLVDGSQFFLRRTTTPEKSQVVWGKALIVRGDWRHKRRRRRKHWRPARRGCCSHLSACASLHQSALPFLPGASGSAESCVRSDVAGPKTGLSRCPSDLTSAQRPSVCHPNPLCAALINAPQWACGVTAKIFPLNTLGAPNNESW